MRIVYLGQMSIGNFADRSRPRVLRCPPPCAARCSRPFSDMAAPISPPSWMAGLVPAIHDFRSASKTWMAGPSQAKPGHDVEILVQPNRKVFQLASIELIHATEVAKSGPRIRCCTSCASKPQTFWEQQHALRDRIESIQYRRGRRIAAGWTHENILDICRQRIFRPGRRPAHLRRR